MDKKGRTAFGARLVAARKHAGLRQIPAAKEAGMAQSTLAELEMDGQGSSYTTQLASLYGVNSTWLATGKGQMLGGVAEPAPLQAVPPTQSDLEKIAGDIADLVQAYRVATPPERSGLMVSARSVLEAAVKRAVKVQ